LKFRLNVWGLKDVEFWMDEEAWDLAGSKDSGGIIPVATTELVGRRCFGGLDVSSTLDITALAWDFPFDDHHAALWRFFVPAARMEDLDARTAGAASGWAADELLIVTEGEVIDYDTITRQIEKDAQSFQVEEIAYHRFGMAQLATDLDQAGLVMVAMTQTTSALSPGTKELERLIIARQYHHGGNPVARWMFGNTAIREDAVQNIRPDKEGSADNITGITAAVMAVDRATRHTDDALTEEAVQ
jgi:phage terminase large subunit-like protein